MAASTTPSPAVASTLRRRRRRRRREDKPPIPARLVLDDHVRGDVGILSEDLFADLFPHLARQEKQEQQQQEHGEPGYGPSSSSSSNINANANTPPALYHVAIAPWAPQAAADNTDWTVVPVARSAALAHSTVQFSPSSLALQSFAASLQQVAPSKLSAGRSRRGIEIVVLDVTAVPLEAVYVHLEGDLAKRLEQGEGTFFRDHPAAGARATAMGSTHGSDKTAPQDHLTAALRVALGTLPVVHGGDLFPLPLPPHPITHVPPNPGKVTFCEPVAQGVLTARTKIIVSRGRLPGKRAGRGGGASSGSLRPTSRKLNGVSENDDDEGNETATDQFYSAAEERERTETEAETDGDGDGDGNGNGDNDDGAGSSGGGGGVTGESDSSELDLMPGSQGDSDEDDHSLSDDSMDDMISLQAPTLPPTVASGVSTVQAGSPMTIGRGRRLGSTTNGIVTPGSVFSSFTATTARPDRPRGRLFRAQGLTLPIPPELLHPAPATEDDEEARVYVDVHSLPRIGCFSGDWVRLEEASEPAPANSLLGGLRGLGGLGGLNGLRGADEDGDGDDSNDKWRPVRVFGLPEGYASRPVTRIPRARHELGGDRRLSFFESQVQRTSSPVAYASPILLANMHGTSYVRLSPLKGAGPASRHGPASTHGAAHGQSHPIGRSVAKAAAMQPPFAHKVVIQQIRTPVPIQKAVQAAVVAGLKGHFERKLRVVKTGDFIAIPIDAQLGRTMEGIVSETAAVGDILAMTGGGNSKQPTARLQADEVAWFKVSQVQAQGTTTAAKGAKTTEDESVEENIWGEGVACVDISTAHLEQSGTTASRIPGTQDSSWRYYLGLEPTPWRAAAAVAEVNRGPVSGLRRQLRQLLGAATSRRAQRLGLGAVAVLLVSTQRGVGKATVAADACADVGLHAYTVDAYDVVNEAGAVGGAGGGGATAGDGSDAKTEGVLRGRAALAMSCGQACCAMVLRHVEALTADRMAACLSGILADARVLVATTTEPDKLPEGVRSLFTHELTVAAPDEHERETILRRAVQARGLSLAPEADLASVALKTAALVAGDLVDVVERAAVYRERRLEEWVQEWENAKASETSDLGPGSIRDLLVAGGPAVRGITGQDLEAAVEAARKNFADAIGAPKIPNVRWSDVGGLDRVKDVVTETIQLPLERPELFARGMKKRSGILFYGPPGTGKTLLAKAIATEYSLNFFSVKGPELLNMYIGESEANVRRVFQRARDARPCVVFFDELDSVAPKRGNQGDSGGVMDRIVSQLLAELDGMSGDGDGDDDDEGSGGSGVFVVGATNRPDLLDPALLRPGRFDTMLYLGVSDTHDKQQRILEALTRKFTLHPDVSLPAVAQTLPFTYTGADFYALCSDAMLKAVTRQAAQVDGKIAVLAAAGRTVSTAHYFDHYATPDDVAVVVTEQDFADANRELVPSISAGELAHYERVRATFEGTRGGDEAPGPAGGPGGPAGLPGQPVMVSRAASLAGSLASLDRRKNRKGKGKAVAAHGDDEEDEEDDDTTVGGGGSGGGSSERTAKGKGKAIIGAFEEQRASDDEELYG